MVPSSAIIIATDSERLMCGGFFLSETICLGSFEFIADYFGGLSPSPRRVTRAPLSWDQIIEGHRPREEP
jgi:hypothetical protein